jgi:hypothetical protein
MLVCIVASRRASGWGSRCSADRSCWAGAHWRQLVPLTTFYPIMFFNITNSCIGLIWWDPIGHPSLNIFYLVYPWIIWVVCYCFIWFWVNILLYPCSNYFVILFMFMSRSLSLMGTWSLTWETRATTRVKWDALGWLIRKASGRLPYPKGARAVGE